MDMGWGVWESEQEPPARGKGAWVQGPGFLLAGEPACLQVPASRVECECLIKDGKRGRARAGRDRSVRATGLTPAWEGPSSGL